MLSDPSKSDADAVDAAAVDDNDVEEIVDNIVDHDGRVGHDDDILVTEAEADLRSAGASQGRKQR